MTRQRRVLDRLGTRVYFITNIYIIMAMVYCYLIGSCCALRDRIDDHLFPKVTR
jgi:hypothetical protein